jgi:hypothetical protein
MEFLSEDELFNILEFVDIENLLNIDISNDKISEIISGNYFWCGRLKKDFNISDDKDCLEKYRKEYKKRIDEK